MADAGTQTLIAQAHHAAMRDTIALLEDRVAATRVGAGGIAQMPVVGVIATAFDHYDSRAADPQLHTHVVVSNKVQGDDGRWRTLDSHRLHKAAVALSESYNAFVADHTARLLGVTWVPVDRGIDRNTGWEIEGVPAALIAEFSRRTTGGSDGAEGIEQVKNRLIEQYVAEHGRQPSAATIAKLRQQATLETRPEKELHSLSELTADWRARAEVVLGEDAPTWAQHLLDQGATEARLRADDLGLEQIENLASVVLMEVANRRATWGRWNLHAETMRQIMGVRFATTDDRIRVLDQIVAHAESESLRLTPDYDRAVPAHYIDGKGNRFQPVDQIAYSSQDILDAEQRLLAHSQRIGGPALTARLVARHTSRKIRGVRLDPDQAARALSAGIEHCVIHTHPTSHAAYYPGAESMALKLVMASDGAILGAQAVGVEGVDKRIDVIATAARGGVTAPELAELELGYAPPFGSAKDPVNMLGYIAENVIAGLSETIQWHELAHWVSQGVRVIDVRTPEEFAAGHIPSALNVELDALRDRLADLPEGRLVVHCAVSQRAHTAAMLLRAHGRDVANLDGGYRTWLAGTTGDQDAHEATQDVA